MKLRLFHVDAFAPRPFTGNPAAVVPLDGWLDDATLHAIAAENNLAETAFLVRGGGGWEIRWRTPTVEVDLCGHATLAAGYVVLTHLEPSAQEVTFATREAGPLTVRRGADGELRLDLPSRPPERCPAPPALLRALGGLSPEACLFARDYVAVLASEADVRALCPRLPHVCELDAQGLIVTAPGNEADFVSRYFAPQVGIDEDPVTGSAHCALVPYWAARLGRTELRARQLSARGGELGCELRGDRVSLGGRVQPYLEGWIEVSG